jgi:hypothetical protein
MSSNYSTYNNNNFASTSSQNINKQDLSKTANVINTQPLYQQTIQSAISLSQPLISSSSNIVVKKPSINATAENDDNFVDLDFVDVQINLKFLSDLKENEKIMILENKYMQVDNRRSIMRYLTSESRHKTLKFINHVVECAKKYCKEDKNIISNNKANIKKLLENSLDGLRNLLTTYKSDKNICSIIKIYETNIDTFAKTL